MQRIAGVLAIGFVMITIGLMGIASSAGGAPSFFTACVGGLVILGAASYKE